MLRILEGDYSEPILPELGVNFLDEAEGDLRDWLSSEDGAFVPAAALLRAENGAGSEPLFWMSCWSSPRPRSWRTGAGQRGLARLRPGPSSVEAVAPPRSCAAREARRRLIRSPFRVTETGS